MFSDLFSALDGCSDFLSWGMTPLLVFLFFNKTFFSCSNSSLFNYLTGFGYGNRLILPFNLFIFVLFFFMISMNLMGLTPFSYSMSSSLWFASTFALLFWFFLIFSGFKYSMKKSLAHFVPVGSPFFLTPILIIIETISVLIRPLTLTVRLIANISAGHIVLSLIANCLTSLKISNSVPVLFISTGYYMFEVFVCFIQAYIFTLLLKLYSMEHPFK
uniref:ATP synthase subunit a n=1 Tax=Planorbella duryi TaxID=129831 RepID=A0A1S6PTN0_9GAST|nr:ATP synthase F0 subunit 6 [Planorbella duryi]